MNQRRDFLKKSIASIAAVYIASQKNLFAIGTNPDKPAKVNLTDKRTLGKTGLKVYPIVFGGIVVMNETPETASKEVEKAIQAGVNYFDVAPTYGDAEQKLGPALEPFLKDVYLACKTTKRDAKGAKLELDQSLERLRTDHFDVYQLHAITDVEKDVKAVFAKGGAMETILEAKKAGKIRNIGFSAHSPEAALAAMDMFDFDTVMYPIAFTTHYTSQFEDQVVKVARNKNIGTIGLKPLAKQKWPEDANREKYPKCWYQPIDDPQLARMSLSWTLQNGADIAVPPGQNELFHLALNQIKNAKPLSSQQTENLKNIAQSIDPIFRA